MDAGLDLKDSKDLFYNMIDRYARHGISPSVIEDMVMNEINMETKYWWQYYEEVQKNPSWTPDRRDLVLDVYELWLGLEDIAHLLVQKTDYATLYTFYDVQKRLHWHN